MMMTKQNFFCFSQASGEDWQTDRQAAGLEASDDWSAAAAAAVITLQQQQQVPCRKKWKGKWEEKKEMCSSRYEMTKF